ncbi:MAG: preprotein translocase subunit SecA [Planctomycetes bacterium]|nr:preprotein translocase subunit SecA [Planctomycetota bacterium]
MVDWDQFTDRLTASWKRVGVGLKTVLGSQNERYVKTLYPAVAEINTFEPWAQNLTQEQMQAKTAEWKEAVQSGKKKLDEVLPEAFALVREAGVRTVKLRHFDVQLMGGMVLHRGLISEMSTGEGKTLVATLPCYLNALEGKGVFVVTVNDYLAKRDRDWMAPIYEYLGLKVGAIQQWMSPEERKPEYAADITYGTNSEFGFDYLRDNMKLNADDQVQKHLNYAIVDEVDSILIDEARTPLIISGPAEKSSEKYMISDRVARRLQPGKHFEIKEKEKQCLLSDEGIEHAQELVGVGSFYQGGNMDWHHMLETALRSHHLYRIDRDYVVRTSEDDGRPEVVIVDEFTGRMMPGRRWSDGLHQAIEAKEGIKPRDENQTLATITYQNYFRLFKKLAGMTGTAMTEAAEFAKIYNLDVASIPTNQPVRRKDNADVVYRTSQEKWKAIVEEIENVHKKGQPVLIGTTSIEKSELLSGMLQRKGIPHQVLNAKQHEREAHVIVHAGEKGALTVATNMAGRGTDIKLGEGVRELGGLYVLGTERHEARRIDNQLRGRGGRQGDPGYSRFYLALEDDLMRIFYSDKTRNLMKMLGMTEGQAIESPMVSRAIEKAQKKVEERNFEIRKSLLEYDEVMDSQRKVVYRARQDALEFKNLRSRTEDMITQITGERVDSCFNERGVDPDLPEVSKWLHRKFGIEIGAEVMEPHSKETRGSKEAKHPLTEFLISAISAKYDETEKTESPENMRRIEQYLLLNVIDSKWKEHLAALDSLKSGINLRSYAQMDPKNEFKQEGYKLFQAMLHSIADSVTEQLFKLHVPTKEEISAGREAERRREDAQRVYQAAVEAGVVQQEAAKLAQAIFDGKLDADEIIQKIVAAKAKLESEGAQIQIPDDVRKRGEDAQRVYQEATKAGIAQPLAMQLAQSILEEKLGAGEISQKINKWTAGGANEKTAALVEATIPEDIKNRHASAQRVFQIAMQAGVVQQQAGQAAQAVFEGRATADEMIEKIKEAKAAFDKQQGEQQKQNGGAPAASGGSDAKVNITDIPGEDGGPGETGGDAPPQGGTPPNANNNPPGARPPGGPNRQVPLRAAFDMHKQMERRRQIIDRQTHPQAPQPPGGGASRPPAQTGGAARSVGRNDPCPCGSGKKYKQCHGRGAA